MIKTPVTYDKIIIIGLGLIGSSIARALRSAGAVKTLVGIDSDSDMIKDGRYLQVIDQVGDYDDTTFADADMVIIAVPMGAIDSLAKKVLALTPEQAVITDVSSAKESVVKTFTEANDGVTPSHFVPGHPIAGTENNGVHAGFATLFQDRLVVLTPVHETNPEAIKHVRDLWEICGATITSMSVEHHDHLFAATSHLPHMLAYTLVDALAQKSSKQEIFQFASGGFRDFTRIASSDPIMWRDVALLNKTAVLNMLNVYRRELDQLIDDIEQDQGDAIEARFRRAKTARDALL